jgi:hypothetical protein
MRSIWAQSGIDSSEEPESDAGNEPQSSKKVSDPKVLKVARNSKLARERLMEEGNVPNAIDRLLKYGAGLFPVSSIAFRHTEHSVRVGPLNLVK